MNPYLMFRSTLLALLLLGLWGPAQAEEQPARPSDEAAIRAAKQWLLSLLAPDNRRLRERTALPFWQQTEADGGPGTAPRCHPMLSSSAAALGPVLTCWQRVRPLRLALQLVRDDEQVHFNVVPLESEIEYRDALTQKYFRSLKNQVFVSANFVGNSGLSYWFSFAVRTSEAGQLPRVSAVACTVSQIE